jgi:uncharacterized membrane protein YqjE
LISGLPHSLRSLAAGLLELLGARVELIAVELQEERARVEKKLVLLLTAALFLAAGVLLGSILLVVLFWDTHRTLAAAGVCLLHLGIGSWALLRLRELNHGSPPPFAATLDEFAHDLKLLRGQNE